jgi:hypothetical protein
MDEAMVQRLAQDQAEHLEEAARSDEVPVLDVIRTAIDEHIERRRKDEAFQARIQASVQHNRRVLERLEDR